MSRRAQLSAAALLACAVALWLGLAAFPDARDGDRVSTSVAASAAAPLGSEGESARITLDRPAAPAAPDPGSAVVSLPERADLVARAAADYREQARYPPWSRPIRDGVDPLVRDREVVVGRSAPADRLPRLEIATDRSTYVAPAPVRVTAALVGADGPVAPRRIEGDVRTARGGIVGELAFEPAEQGAFVAELAPEQTVEGALRGVYLVVVRAEDATGEERAASSGFAYGSPGAVLTGRYVDSVESGDLVIDAELEVFDASRFHLEATLADATGMPIAWAQAAEMLSPGSAWLRLRFYGLVLRESGAAGPYRLASVALTTVDGMPNQKSDLVRDAYETQPHDPEQFGDTPYDDPELLRLADELEDG